MKKTILDYEAPHVEFVSSVQHLVLCASTQGYEEEDMEKSSIGSY